MNDGTIPEQYSVTFWSPVNNPEEGFKTALRTEIVEVFGHPPQSMFGPFGQGFTVGGFWYPVSSVVEVRPLNGAPMSGCRQPMGSVPPKD